ncbi:leucine-rich repeat-containing protein 74B [Austrofundulus limnaeus]|uniref:Leucine-rich repeat-containing protein 74B n=1 Tax=Austrofundulus limnaeus TaxID=52670 RepID=A0A2I4BFS8_AUSLI|nr:PREDICTED: leucine-rich repeat-containing protein 74B [Austrofundulus limnaeus]
METCQQNKLSKFYTSTPTGADPEGLNLSTNLYLVLLNPAQCHFSLDQFHCFAKSKNRKLPQIRNISFCKTFCQMIRNKVMVDKKFEVLLPSVLKDEEEELQLRERTLSQTEDDVRGPKDQHSRQSAEAGGQNKTKEEKKGWERQNKESDEDSDTDLELGDQEETEALRGKVIYMKACEKLQVAPVSRFLKNMHTSELALMHYGLGPKGTKALAVPLTTNTSIRRLNLRDNWMGEMGGASIAKMLEANRCITAVDLSDNNLRDLGARAISNMLKGNNTLVSLQLSGNHFTDQSAEYLGPALISNTTLQHLDLSYNALGQRAGQTLGFSVSENTGLRSLSLAWNCIPERGLVMLANGLRENISLRSVDLSYNDFGEEGAAALGQALKENNILEELNVSNNRIPPGGAIHLAGGLRVNKTIKFLNIGRNPIQTAGCLKILQSLQENPDSSLETLDFSDIAVNQEFEDLYAAVKETFSALRVKHGGTFGPLRKAKS